MNSELSKSLLSGGIFMLALLLAIFSSASIALLFKITENGHHNRYIVTSANYFAAFIVSLWLYIDPIKAMQAGTLNAQDIPFLPLMRLGIPAGVFFFLSFIFYQVSVKENGASLSAMFGKLGILVPMIISIVIWHEMPTSIQLFGMLLAFSSIIIINFNPSAQKSLMNRGVKISLILLFITGGLAEFSNKLFQKLSLPDEKNLFLFFVFFTAFVCSLLFAITKKKNGSRHYFSDIGLGLLVGIPNLLSSFFLISALNVYPAALVFPLYSSGSIVLVMILSFVLFKERLSKRALVGIGLTLLALVFIA